MPKSVLHDIIAKERRTIREVPLPKRQQKAPDVEPDAILYEREEVVIQDDEPTPDSSGRRFLLWGTAVFFLGLLVVALASRLTGATVTITPKTASLKIDQEFTASLGEARLNFQIVPMSETVEILIPADTTKKVQEKAKGTIVIYNNFSDAPQRLIRNTRFETPKGQIYRIDSSIAVPGRSLKDGRKIPGSVEALVIADSPGIEYNIPPSDFTVPGFRTDAARFAGFYARSKTPLSGGFDGTIKVPSDAAVTAARVSLKGLLLKKVTAEKQNVNPDSDSVLFEGALTTQSESLPLEKRNDGLSAVREKMNGAVYVFKKDAISKAIAMALIPDFNNLPIEIPNLSSLLFEFTEVPTGNAQQVKAIRFTLKGTPHIVWQYDAKKLKGALAGKQRSELPAILTAFPTLERAELVLRPFWSRSFPSNPQKIILEQAPTLPTTTTP